MMDKKRLEMIITAALILVLIFAWANSAKTLKKRSSPTGTLGSTPIQTRVYPGQEKEEISGSNLVWGRCPFSGKIYTEKEGLGIVNLKLDGIIWDRQQPLAVINGRVLEIGGRIEGNTVVDIKEDRVILNNGSNNLELKLGR